MKCSYRKDIKAMQPGNPLEMQPLVAAMAVYYKHKLPQDDFFTNVRKKQLFDLGFSSVMTA
jgi:hypothetical protein